MKIPFSFKSISTRLIFYVTLSVLAMFTIVVGLLMFVQSLLAIGLFSMAVSWYVDSQASTVEKQLVEVQTTVLAHDVKVINNLNSPKQLTAVFQDILYHDNIYACGIALKPDSTGARYLLYATRNEQGGVTVTQRAADYAYEERDYFKETERRMETYWSDPYLDGTQRVATFSRPLLDNNGDFLGVLCADVQLDSIASFIATDPGTSNSTIVASVVNQLFEGIQSKRFILSRSGYFVTMPDSTVDFNDTYETYALRHTCQEFKRIGETMVKRDKEGAISIFDDIELDGDSYNVSYSYINKVGWTVVLMYPTAFFYGAITGLVIIILFMFVVGVLLLILIIYMIVRRSIKPLEKLVAATKDMSHGNFDIELPQARHRDEIQTLRDSFDDMRVSLRDYVERLKESTAQNERMEQELNIASNIQMSMLPVSFPCPPQVEEVSIHAFLKSAREVGGDLYDFFIRSGRLHFIIADVSGKGMPAAMIMAVTTSMFRALQRRDIAPDRTVNALNNMLLERGSADMFVTLLVGDLNLTTGELSICNAGHTPPILITEGSEQYVQLHRNLPIGVFPNYHYKANQLKLTPSARLLLYTDGVTEATNANEDLFGEERLVAATHKYGGKNVESFINSMVNDISAFTGDTQQNDDLTIMMIEYHGSNTIINHEIKFSNDMGEVSRVTALIEEVCEKLEVDFAVTTSLQLAVEEAMVNVISYAHENGRDNIDNHFKIASDGKSITFTLIDNGIPFDPTQATMPDVTLGIEERGVGGLGILLVKKIMDTVTYHRTANHNVLIMKKNI